MPLGVLMAQNHTVSPGIQGQLQRNAVVAHSSKLLQRPHRKRDPRFPGMQPYVLDRLLAETPSPETLPLDDASAFLSNYSTSISHSRSPLAFDPSGLVDSAPRGAALETLAQPQILRVTTEEKPQRTRNKERTPDYFANVGDAIRTLREDIPDLFGRDLNYSIYRDDIVFRDPRNKLEGIKNYKLLFWSLRFHGRIFFSRLYVEIKRIWQPTDDVIKMRWTVHGNPRVPWEAEGLFDGISTYKLDNTGRVYEHSVDNVVLRDPPMLTSPLNLVNLNLIPNSVPQQQPCPGAWYMPSNSAQLQQPQQQDQQPALQPVLADPCQGLQEPVLLWHTRTLLTTSTSGMVSRAAPLAGLPDLATSQHLQHTIRQTYPARQASLAAVKRTLDAAQPATLQSACWSWVAGSPSEAAAAGVGAGNDVMVAAADGGSSSQPGWSSNPGWRRLRQALTASESLLGLQGVGATGEDGVRASLTAGSMEPSPSR